MHSFLLSALHKNSSMKFSFLKGGFKVFCAIINSKGTIAKSTPLRVEMKKRSHNVTGIVPKDPFLFWYQVKQILFCTQAIIGHRLNFIKALEFIWIGYPIKNIDGGIARGD